MSAEDWIAGAVAVLLRDGPDAVAVQPIARRIGTSKGSFYWYFQNRDDLLRAALERWHQLATEDVIVAVEASSDDPREKARLLIARVTASSIAHPGQLQLLGAVDNPLVAAALDRATTRRIDYIAELLRAAGHTRAVAARRARLAYATYLGHAQLAHSTPSVLPTSPAGRRKLLAEMTRAVLDD